MEDFIGHFENAYSDEQCYYMIKIFEKLSASNLSYDRQRSEKANGIHKKDLAVNSMDFMFKPYLMDYFDADFLKIFWTHYETYCNKFDTVKLEKSHNLYSFKIQKTIPGQGYHVWHYENNVFEYQRRLITWIVYLNDDYEGGETEFLYLSKRIKPKKGTLIMWPAGFTHTHRGNPPLSGEKYIVTGWTESNG